MKLIHVTDTSGRKVAIVAGNIGAVMPATCNLGGKDTPITAIMMVRFEDGAVWDVKESYADIIAQLETDETDEMRKQIAKLSWRLANAQTYRQKKHNQALAELAQSKDLHAKDVARLVGERERSDEYKESSRMKAGWLLAARAEVDALRAKVETLEGQK